MPAMVKTILLVDDDPLYVELVKEVLELHHHRIVAAYNGKEALALLAAHQFDAIISDIEMPVMNGMAFYERVSAHEAFRKIPFIFLTGSEDPQKLRAVKENLHAVLIKKPDIIETLPATVASLTHGKHA
jgi:CheY-like chemotaxis protein